jgi:hypothetical protein
MRQVRRTVSLLTAGWTAAFLLSSCRVSGNGPATADRMRESGPIGTALPASDCVPSYRDLGPDPIATALPGSTTVTTQWLLIGCRRGLDQLTDREIAKVRAALSTIVEGDPYTVPTAPRDGALRETYAARVNKAIGRRVVTDLYLARWWTGEAF